MATICGILGRSDPDTVKAMARAMKHRGDARFLQTGRNYAVASSDEIPARALCVVDGAPRDASGKALSPRSFHRLCEESGAPSHVDAKGPFAAVLRMKGEGGWWLMRNRMGIKPLYYFQAEDYLLFASELKGIMASGLVPKRINLLSVDRYLTLRCVPGPESIIQDVRRVQPGHAIVYSDGALEEHRFAGFRFRTESTSRESAAREVENLLGEAMEHATARGLLWSGGLDCASLAALDPGRRPVHVVLRRAWQNEQRLSRESARLLHLDLNERKARPLSEAVFRKVLYHLDEPVADASALPLWLILEGAAQTEKSLVSGHGADELLGGYPRYNFIHKAQGSAQGLVPTSLLSALLPALPPNAFIQRGSQYLTKIRDSFESYLSLLAVFDQSERDDLYTEAMKAVIHEHGGSASMMSEHFKHAHLTQNQLSLDLSVTLPDIILAQCDRIAAAHGLNLEFPYLHDPLVDLVTTLPPSVKFGVRSKPLLRLAMKNRLPGRIRMRARRGFRVPQEGQVMQVVEQFAQQTLTPERVEASGLFKWQHVERIMHSHSHNVYRRRQFWALLMFFGWYREFMET